MAGYITIDIRDEDVKNLLKVMRSAGRDLRRDMGKEIRHVAQPVIGTCAQRSAAWPARHRRREPSGPTGAGGITGRIAAATKVSITGRGVRIRVNNGSLGNARKLPAYIDAGKTWRHPVMGNRRAWVSQTASEPGWFTKTGLRTSPQIKREVTEILMRYAAQMAARL